MKYEEMREKRKKALEIMKSRVKDEYLVLLKPYSDYVKKLYKGVEISQTFIRNLEQFGEVKYVYKYIPAISIKQESPQFFEVVNSPDMKEVIESVERNRVISIPTPIQEKSIDEHKLRERMWNLEMVESYEARKFSKGAGVVVAVVDTGADYEHPEIEDNFIRSSKGYNVIEDNDDPMDDHGHGTHCSGIIAGRNVGVAPSVTLKAVKFLNALGFGTLEDAIKSIEWCIDNDVDITSNSWGSGFKSEALEAIFDVAWENGILSVAAAGNSGMDSIEYPAFFDSVISVPAVDKDEKRPYWSTANEHTEIAAPGVNVYSCLPEKKYAEWSGTSMATPHVAGGAAIIKSFYGATNKKIRENLRRYAKQKGEKRPNKEYGYGILQIYKTLIGFQ